MNKPTLGWSGLVVLVLLAVLATALVGRQIRAGEAACTRHGGRYVQVDLWTYRCDTN